MSLKPFSESINQPSESLPSNKYSEQPSRLPSSTVRPFSERIDAESYKEDEFGGPGSGNFDHAGRPGKIGGSGPGTGSVKTAKAKGLGGADNTFETPNFPGKGDVYIPTDENVPKNIQKERTNEYKELKSKWVQDDKVTNFESSDIKKSVPRNVRGEVAWSDDIRNPANKELVEHVLSLRDDVSNDVVDLQQDFINTYMDSCNPNSILWRAGEIDRGTSGVREAPWKKGTNVKEVGNPEPWLPTENLGKTFSTKERLDKITPWKRMKNWGKDYLIKKNWKLPEGEPVYQD